MSVSAHARSTLGAGFTILDEMTGDDSIPIVRLSKPDSFYGLRLLHRRGGLLSVWLEGTFCRWEWVDSGCLVPATFVICRDDVHQARALYRLFPAASFSRALSPSAGD